MNTKATFVAGVLAPAQLLWVIPSTAASIPAITTNNQSYANSQIGEMQTIVSDSRYASVFGGLAGDPATHVVTVFVAPSAAQAAVSEAENAIALVGSQTDPKIAASPKVWTLRYEVAGPSLAVLNGALSKVTSAEPWTSDVKGSLIGYGIDPTIHAVRIDVSVMTSQITADAQSTFGALAVLDTAERPYVTSGQQLYDQQPYFGGDALYGLGGYIHCTTGFAAYTPNNGHRGMLTAGHCYSLNDTATQGTSLGTTGTVGRVTIESYANNVVDAAFVDSSATGTTVEPDVNTSVAQGQNVSTTGTSFVGLSPCTDGGVSAENCHGIVQQVDYCMGFTDGFNHCHVTKVSESHSNPALCQPGDSGGPVYSPYTGSSIEAYGLINGVTDIYTCWYDEIGPTVAQLGTPVLTTGIAQPTPSALGDRIQDQQQLIAGQYLSSSGQTLYGVKVWKYFLAMQPDGNLVVYSPSGALWWTNTQTYPSAYAVMQADGNLVVYRQGGVAVWNSGTQGHPHATLVMQTDGNLVIYAPGAVPLWTSNTCCYRA